MSSKEPLAPDDLYQDGCWMDQARKREPEVVLIGDSNFVYLQFTQAIVIMIGVNNVLHTSEDIVDDILRIIELIKVKQPKASVIVMGLLPCGRISNPRRVKHENINKLLEEALDAKPGVTFINPNWDIFIQPDGTISHRDMFDYVHPTENGFGKLCEPLIDELHTTVELFKQ